MRFGANKGVVIRQGVTLALGLVLGTIGASAKQFGYVPNQGSNNVSVIDTSTDSVVTNVKSGLSPVRLTITPDGNKVYVANIGGQRVTSILTTNNSIGPFVTVGDAPAEMLTSPDGSQVFVPCAQGAVVSVINTATDSLITNLPAAANCRAIIWVKNPAGSNYVVVANQGAFSLTVIDPVATRVVTNIPVGGGPRRLAATPSGAKLYSANYQSDNVSVIDMTTLKRTTNITVGKGPRGVTVSPDGTEVWCTNLLSNNVSIISVATDTVITNLPTGILPWTVIFSRDGSRAYVLNSGNYNVSVFDAKSRQLLKTVPVGAGCFWAEFNSDGTKLYVTDPPDGTVSVINTSNNLNIATIPTGASAWVIALTPDDPPKITSVFPTNVQAGTTVQMDVLGSAFRLGAKPVLIPTNAAVTFTNINLLGSDELAFTMILATNSVLGPVSLQIQNSDGTTGALANAITILPPPPAPPPPPTVATVTPNQVTVGSTVSMIVQGTKFQPGAAVSVLGNPAGFSVAGAVALNTNQISFDLTIAANASLGTQGLTVTNPDGQSGSVGNLFTVLPAPPPVISGVTPNAVTAGDTMVMTLTGDKFLPGATIAPYPGNLGITIVGVDFVNKQTLTVYATLAANVTTGVQGFTVANLDGQSASSSSLFTILPAPPPVVTDVIPNELPAGGSYQVEVDGAGFLSGVTVTPVPANAGVAVTSIQSFSENTLLINVSVEAAATRGWYALKVANLDNQSVTTQQVLNVTGSPLPAVSGVTPTSFAAGNAVAMTITGNNFQPGATVTLTPLNSGATISNVQIVNASTITLTLSTTLSAATGSFGFTVTNPDNLSGAGGNLFTIMPAPLLTITSITPQTIGRNGVTALAVQGASFQPNTTVMILKAGQGVQLAGATFINSSNMTINVSVSATSPTGWRDLRVANGSSAFVFANAFAVLSSSVPPVIDAVSPNQITAGTVVSMTITGDKFQSGATVSVAGNPAGLTVSNVSFVNANQINFTLTTAVNAPLGSQGVKVTNPDGQSTTADGLFTVLTAPAPTISGVSPAQVLAGQNVAMTLSGTGFQPGIAVIPSPANAGMTITSVTVVNSSTLSLQVSFSTGATPGSQGFKVTNSDGQFAAAGNLFTIQTAPLPSVTGASLGSVTAGESVAMTVTGANFQPGASVSLAPGNAGVSISNVQAVDANTITLTLTTTLSAASGSFGFTVTNPNTLSGTGNDLFTIQAAPPLSITGATPQLISRNATTTLMVSGTSFQPNSTVTILKAGAGVQLVGVMFINTTTLQIDVSVSATSALGWRDLRVANGATSVTFTNAFRVQ